MHALFSEPLVVSNMNFITSIYWYTCTTITLVYDTYNYSWLVVSNMNFIFSFHIWDNRSHWRTYIFQDCFLTTNQYLLASLKKGAPVICVASLNWRNQKNRLTNLDGKSWEFDCVPNHWKQQLIIYIYTYTIIYIWHYTWQNYIKMTYIHILSDLANYDDLTGHGSNSDTVGFIQFLVIL